MTNEYPKDLRLLLEDTRNKLKDFKKNSPLFEDREPDPISDGELYLQGAEIQNLIVKELYTLSKHLLNPIFDTNSTKVQEINAGERTIDLLHITTSKLINHLETLESLLPFIIKNMEDRYDDGYEDGEKEGKEQGKNEGYDIGYRIGYKDGYKKGKEEYNNE